MALPWQRAIVVGASSGIGAALARRLGRDGASVALVARREPELEAVAGAIRSAGGGRARVYPHDVVRGEAVPGLAEVIWHDLGGCDLFVFAAGIMPRLAEDEYDFAKDRETVAVNLLGAIAWLNEAARRFGSTGAGTIVGLGSVAGDRGRRGHPVYAATKAALDTYLEAIRNRLGPRGVTVVTVKPGPVDTPMSRGLNRRPFLISADRAAAGILTAAARRRPLVYVPARWRPIMLVLRALPSWLFQRLPL